MKKWMTMAGLWKRNKRRSLQEVAQGGNVLCSPEYLAMCARGLKDKCKNTPYMGECIFAEDGTCKGNCTLYGSTPDFWKEKRWPK